MIQSPWKEIENNKDTIRYLNESLRSIPLLIVASRFEPYGMDKRESWWAINYYVAGEAEGTILEHQDSEFFEKYGISLPRVVKGKKNAMKVINNFINPKRYRFDILTHQCVPKGYSTNDPKEAQRLLEKAREFDNNATIIDNQDFYPKNEWTW